MLNPYRKEAASGSSGCSTSNEKGSHNNKVIEDPSSSMGIQSQNREGSISKCKSRSKRTVKHKHAKDLVQTSVDGGPAFVARRDCVVCKSKFLKKMGLRVSISHRAHEERCLAIDRPSARTKEVNKFAKEMMAINTMPLIFGQTEGLPSVSQHFQKTTTTTTRIGGTTTITRTSDEAEKLEGNY
jgi:hypothetical protein